ncbi:hypothetical protein KGQ20_34515 [Catenulispora sp. NF23]|uniref:hypothetical protein n=1 Tax=Catenulispora pinistramenti TaxID=2705254 RepID=UPI001BAA44C6|nr:hypothetical protein [Catenulispora pinistramenti]MBS2537880.1 hypothetical protein [Catenulispora pinistramenti]
MDVEAAVEVVVEVVVEVIADPVPDPDPVGLVAVVRAGSPAAAERLASRDTCDSVRPALPVARSAEVVGTGAGAFPEELPEESSGAVGAEAPGASATSSFCRARSISGTVIASPATTAVTADRRNPPRRRGAVRRWLAGRRAAGVSAPDQSSEYPDRSSERPDRSPEYPDQPSEY